MGVAFGIGSEPRAKKISQEFLLGTFYYLCAGYLIEAHLIQLSLQIVPHLFGTFEINTSFGFDRIKVQFLFVVFGNLNFEDDTFFA
jgi:hypothetical protein